MEDKSYPETIYKYRDWSNEFHKSILTKNEVFLSPPLGFNDPFDCRIPNNYLTLDSDEKKKDFVDRIAEQHASNFRDRDIKVEDWKVSMLKRLEDIEQFHKEQESNEIGLQDERYGILSLTTRWNSILMWSHYGNFHKGFCVGFNEVEMRDSLLFGKGGRVLYSTEFPDLPPDIFLTDEEQTINGFKKLFTKAKDWEYEDEYRLASTFPNKADLEDPRRVVTLPEFVYKEIVLGIMCSEQDKNDLQDIAKEKGIPIYQAVKRTNHFLIDRVPIG